MNKHVGARAERGKGGEGEGEGRGGREGKGGRGGRERGWITYCVVCYGSLMLTRNAPPVLL